MAYLLNSLTKKNEVDCIIGDTIDKVLVLRFGRPSDATCLQLDNILAKSVREVSKFAAVALVDIGSDDVQVYVNTADHTKWVGAFHRKKDFIDVVEVSQILGGLTIPRWGSHDIVLQPGTIKAGDNLFCEAIYRGAMKGKLIVSCPLPSERILRYQLLYKDV